MVFKNIIRVGKVSSINYESGHVRVIFEDKDNIVSDEIPCLSFEYNMPSVGDSVLCIFLPNGISRGICIGKFFSRKNISIHNGEGIYFKDFFGEGYIKYDKGTKTLIMSAENIEIDGNLKVTGTLDVNGNITSGGSIIGTTGNTNHHSHY